MTNYDSDKFPMNINYRYTFSVIGAFAALFITIYLVATALPKRAKEPVQAESSGEVAAVAAQPVQAVQPIQAVQPDQPIQPALSQETIAQRCADLAQIEQNCKQELENYLRGRFKDPVLEMAGDPSPDDPSGMLLHIPDNVIAISLRGDDFGSFTETELSAFAKEIALFYLINNPYIDSCQIELYPGLFVKQWARVTEVVRHQNMQKEFADSYKVLTK